MRAVSTQYNARLSLQGTFFFFHFAILYKAYTTLTKHKRIPGRWNPGATISRRREVVLMMMKKNMLAPSAAAAAAAAAAVAAPGWFQGGTRVLPWIMPCKCTLLCG
jgi:hypothetical protein